MASTVGKRATHALATREHNADRTQQTRGRLGELGVGNGVNTGEQSQNFGMPAIGSTYANNWNTAGIWGSTIGSGVRPASNESGRATGRQGQFANGDNNPNEAHDSSAVEVTDGVTGSGSLLSSSESEGWSRRGSTQLPAAIGDISAGLASARGHHGNASPVRSRANHPSHANRSNSPFHSAQMPGVGAAGTNKASHLNPRSRNFNASGMFNTNGSFDAAGSHIRPDDAAVIRNNMASIQFGSLNNSNGNSGYSGYASSAASRSGSLPPSRHGTEHPTNFGEQVPGSFHTSHSDFFNNRQSQSSRTANFATPGMTKFSDPTWSTQMSELNSSMGKFEVGKENVDSYVNNQQISPPPLTNGAWAAGQGFQRSGSVSFDQENGLQQSAQAPHNQYRFPYNERPSHSPNDSETTRRSHDSPLYFSPTPPQLAEHNRAFSTNSSRNNSTVALPYNQAALERKLRNLAEQQQLPMFGTQPSPATSFRHPYLTYDMQYPVGRQQHGHQPYYPGTPQMASYPSTPAPSRAIPRGPALDTPPSENLRSPLLEEFRTSKGSKRYELKDIYGHVVEFSGDQHGSRFIQQKLETANSDEKAQLFSEILPNAWQLITDVFGNYVIQKFFEHGNQTQKKQLAEKMKGHIADLSLQMYGCRVVQKAFEHILTDQQAILVKELEHCVLKCVKDQNGNHVVQKAIQRIPAEHISFIINAFSGQVQHLATHPYGCRVVQRLLEHCPEPARIGIIEELHACSLNLIIDQYGNYVTQHVIEHGRPEDRLKIITLTIRSLIMYSKHKFASNVVEKCIDFGTDEQRKVIVGTISAVDENGESPMHQLMRDQFGNYVIQKILRTLEGEEYQNFVALLRPQILKARQFSYGKQIGQIEKLMDTLSTTQNKTPLVQAQQPQQLDVSAAPTPPPLTEDTQSPQSSSQPSTNGSTVDGPISDNQETPRKENAMPRPASVKVAGEEGGMPNDSS